MVGGPPPQRSEVAIDGKCENESARASGSVVFEIDFWFFLRVWGASLVLVLTS